MKKNNRTNNEYFIRKIKVNITCSLLLTPGVAANKKFISKTNK